MYNIVDDIVSCIVSAIVSEFKKIKCNSFIRELKGYLYYDKFWL